KFVDLREHAAIAVEESETESRDFALRCIFLTTTDVTVKSCGQRSVKSNPLIRQRQIHDLGRFIALNEIERRPGGQIKQSRMHRPHLDIRRKVLPQFQLRQCLTLSDVQALKISPAWAEVEIALLAGSVLLVKIDAARRTPLADFRDILICRNRLLVACN